MTYAKVYNKQYVKDEHGVWWFLANSRKPGKHKRIRAGIFKCCECGKKFPRYKDYVKDPSHAFCSKKCSNKATGRIHKITRKGANNPSWKGGKRLDGNGYVLVYSPDHPYRDKRHSIVKEHRLVMESMIGRYLLPKETVHHRNGVRNDNRPENLELWSGSHPPTMRASDLVIWAKQILNQYEPSALAP